jgi:hypothetical protein
MGAASNFLSACSLLLIVALEVLRLLHLGLREELEAPRKCITAAFCLWHFKPGETSPFPRSFEAHNGPFIEDLRVLGPNDFEAGFLPRLGEFRSIQRRWHQISPWVVKTDLARLACVYLDGGFYFDSDCLITRNLPSTEADEAVLFVESVIPWFVPLGLILGEREDKSPSRRTRVANYGFGAVQPLHSFFRACLRECERRLEALDYTSRSDADTLWLCGPDVPTTVYHRAAGAHKVRLLEKKYLRHLAAGSWR